jgi:hypothetical protein
MHMPLLPPDDLPPSQSDRTDELWRRQLEESISRYFYESCDGVLQALLIGSEWYITTQAIALTLVINCPDMPTTWRVLNYTVQIGKQLEKFSSAAKIRICPPVETEAVHEFCVSEISTDRNLIKEKYNLS